jgi:hypothetical protein
MKEQSSLGSAERQISQFVEDEEIGMDKPQFSVEINNVRAARSSGARLRLLLRSTIVTLISALLRASC